MNARWTITPASAKRARSASGSRMSPCRYSVFCNPRLAGSNGRRAIPRMRPTCGSSARRNARPISPVGPVTATVRSLIVKHDPRGLALALDARLHGPDLMRARPREQLVGGGEPREGLEVLDRREDHQQIARLRALERAARLEP